MVRIIVDGEAFDAREGDNLLAACLSQGLDLPYFCWHPAMDSVGACRQCAVTLYQDDNDDRGRLTMACMTPVKDGARLDIRAPQAVRFRASVIEWLMQNHPHDCPVCEEGGECHLQDMTVMVGHTLRRYRGPKRTFENQYLGPFINHEMNRCITCYRCVRFYRDYAGGTDLAAFGSRGRMYFGRAASGTLESEFSGNLVEVCPTGVFTDKPFSQMYTRKWDLQSAPSVCTGCSLGCNTFAHERYGAIKRIHNRYHASINRYFICDRGRFGMAYNNSASRIHLTGERKEPGVFRQLQPADAVQNGAQMLRAGRAIGIGSPRASLEDNLALRKLVGQDHFSTGIASDEFALLQEAAPFADLSPPTLSEVETADAVLILGEDLLNTAPRLALAIRQATRNLAKTMATDAGIPSWQDAGVRSHAQRASNPVFSATFLPTRLEDIVTQNFNGPPEALVACAGAIATALGSAFHGDSTAVAAEVTALSDFATAAAGALHAARRPLVVTGTHARAQGLITAAAEIVRTLGGDARLLICGAEANTFGVARFRDTLDLNAALDQAANGEAATLVVLQNDLYRRADPERVARAFEGARHVIVLDHLDNPTANHADLLFPAATVAESTGTLVNYEPRAQRFFQVFVPSDNIRPAWYWVGALARAIGNNECRWAHVDDLLDELDGTPEFAGIRGVSPPADWRTHAGQRVARQPHRYSGRTAMYADEMVHEPKSSVDQELPFAYSMEGADLQQTGQLMPYVWAPGWNSNQSVFKFQQEVGGPLRGGDSGVRLTPSMHGAAARPDLLTRPPAKAPAFRLLAQPVLFGSEELTAYAPAVAARMPVGYAVLHPADARTLGVGAGDGVRCGAHTLEVRLDHAMARGSAAVPVGLPTAPAWLGEQPVTLYRDADFVRRPTIIARG